MNRIDAELISRLRDYSDKSACMAHWHTQEGLRDDADYWSRHSQDLLAAADALHSQAQEREGWPTADVREMKAGADSGFYVCVQVGSRYLTPNRYREKWMADFDAAEWNALFTGGERPDICAFDPFIAAAPTGGSET